MGRVAAIITIIASVIGALFLFVTLTSSNGAPQEGAGAAIAVAFTVIPYCAARAINWARFPRDQ